MYTKKLRGVNFGGWLLLEKWMTPTLFADTHADDEYGFMYTPDARQKLEQHRRTFITEADFVWLQANGLNAVRIPVGYWVLEDAEPYASAASYLDWAMETAKKYSIQVIIDLHGLPGSQNGNDHSGKKGKAEWFRHTKHRQTTLDILEALAIRYRDYDTFWGLQIINEPKVGLVHTTLRLFYRQAYARLSRVLKPHTRIIFSDAYTPRLLATALRHQTHPVVMDVHFYHATTLFSRFLSLEWFLAKTAHRKRLLTSLSKKHPVIIGEWSGVLRHEHMRTMPLHQQTKLFRHYTRLQIDAFSPAAGWFYWNYKTEAPGVWNFRSEVEAGLIELT